MLDERKHEGRKSTDKLQRGQYIEHHIKKFLDKKDHEQIYFKSRDETCTREYNTSSAQNLPRDIRAQSTEDYDSVDCDACNPSCLIIVCNRLGFEVPQIIMNIVTKKSEIRKSVAESNNVSVEEAKKMINK